MPTQHKDTARLPIQVGDWIAWTDNDDQEHEDEVIATSDKRITTATGSARWDSKNLRVIPKPAPPPADATSHQPRDGETRALPLQWIAPSPLNPRKTFVRETLEGLAESIKETGLIQSLVVRPTEDWKVVSGRSSGQLGWFVQHTGFPGAHWDVTCEYLPHFFPTREEAEAFCPRWELIAGERRFRASLLAGLAEVDCRIRTGLDDAAAYRMMIDENEEREPVNPIDEALSLHVMLVKGVSQRRLAEVLGNKSQSKISRMAALVELPEPVKELGRAGKFQASHLERLAKWKGRPELCTAIAEIAAEKRASVRELEAKLPFEDELAARKLVKPCSPFGLDFDLKEACQRHPEAFVPGPYQGHFYCLDMQLYARLVREGKQAQAEKQQRETAAALERAGLTSESDLPNINGLHNIIRLDYEAARTPSCDCATCPCARKAWDPITRKVTLYCSDPARLRELKAQDDAKVREARTATAEDAFEQVLARIRETGEITGRDLIYLVFHEDWSYQLDEYGQQAAELLGLELPEWDDDPAAARAALTGLTPIELRNLLVLSRAIEERDDRIRWGGTEPVMEWYLGIEPPAPQASEKPDAPAAPWPCQRCGEDIDDEALLAPQETIGERVFVTGEGGIILTAKGGAYCATCAPDVAICHLCGCTDEFGCDEGCDWLTSELCTACAKKLEQNRGEVSVACHDCGAALDPREGLLGVMRAGRLAHVCEGCKAKELEAARAQGEAGLQELCAEVCSNCATTAAAAGAAP